MKIYYPIAIMLSGKMHFSFYPNKNPLSVTPIYINEPLRTKLIAEIMGNVEPVIEKKSKKSKE